MRIATNEKLIKSRARVAQVLGLAGLGILVIGMVISIRPEFFSIAYVALIVGILLSSIGVYNGEKWVKPPRADVALGEALKGLDSKHELYNWVLPANHVLLSPSGLTVFVVKRQEGRIEYDGQRFRHHQGVLGWVGALNRERLGDPLKDLQLEESRLRDLVAQIASDAEVPIDGYIVFTHPKANLEIEDGSAPAVHVRDLKKELRSQVKRTKMTEETRRKLEEGLDEVAAPKLSA